jgi:hypothetical protein
VVQAVPLLQPDKVMLEVLVDPAATSLILEALAVEVVQVLLEQLDKLQVLLTLLVEQAALAWQIQLLVLQQVN